MDIKGGPWSTFQLTANQVQQKIVRAMLMTAGFRMTAEADRADAVAGEPVKVTIRYSCRRGVECPVTTSTKSAPAPMHGPFVQVAGAMKPPSDDDDYTKGVEYAITLSNPHTPNTPLKSLDPESKSVEQVACAKVAFDDHISYASMHCEPIVHTEATSTHAEQVQLRLVPAYTLAVDPGQIV